MKCENWLKLGFSEMAKNHKLTQPIVSFYCCCCRDSYENQKTNWTKVKWWKKPHVVHIPHQSCRKVEGGIEVHFMSTPSS